MTFSSDRPQKTENGETIYTWGTYGFDRFAPMTPYSISDHPDRELITIYATCEESIMECIKTIHHENGHRQSHELANEHGGWGDGITYWWRDDVEVEELWAGEDADNETRIHAVEVIWEESADGAHKIFEMAHDDFEPNRRTLDLAED